MMGEKHWRIIGAAVILAILVILIVGYLTTHEFVRDFAANLAADAVVAVVAFAVINMGLGLRERRQRQVEAREKALSLLFIEVTDNEMLLVAILRALKGEVPMPESWPPIRSETWQLLIQSPLSEHLHQDLLWNLQVSYVAGAQAAERARDWRAEPAWEPHDDVPEDLVSHVERALKGTEEAALMLRGIGGKP